MVAPLQLQDTSGFPGHLPQPQRHDVKSKKPTEVLQTLWFSPSLSGQGFRPQTQAIPAPQPPFPTPHHLLGDERKREMEQKGSGLLSLLRRDALTMPASENPEPLLNHRTGPVTPQSGSILLVLPKH